MGVPRYVILRTEKFYGATIIDVSKSVSLYNGLVDNAKKIAKEMNVDLSRTDLWFLFSTAMNDSSIRLNADSQKELEAKIADEINGTIEINSHYNGIQNIDCKDKEKYEFEFLSYDHPGFSTDVVTIYAFIDKNSKTISPILLEIDKARYMDR